MGMEMGKTLGQKSGNNQLQCWSGWERAGQCKETEGRLAISPDRVRLRYKHTHPQPEHRQSCPGCVGCVENGSEWWRGEEWEEAPSSP